MDRLRDHADIGSTHIISAILNVAQDTDHVWWLHILDHEGRRHYIEMDAGDSKQDDVARWMRTHD